MSKGATASGLIYKILPQTEWKAAQALGEFPGSGIDLADGYIHFSTAGQAGETARKYFAGQAGLLVLHVGTQGLGPSLKWEPSRGGDLFPHLYRSLKLDEVRAVSEAPLDPDGLPQLGSLS